MDVHIPQAITDQLRRRGVDISRARRDCSDHYRSKQVPGNRKQVPGNDKQVPGNGKQVPGNDKQVPGY